MIIKINSDLKCFIHIGAIPSNKESSEGEVTDSVGRVHQLLIESCGRLRFDNNTGRFGSHGEIFVSGQLPSKILVAFKKREAFFDYCLFGGGFRIWLRPDLLWFEIAPQNNNAECKSNVLFSNCVLLNSELSSSHVVYIASHPVY